MNRIWMAGLLSFVCIHADVFCATKDSYQPYPLDSREIIQADDYATIEAIETFVTELESGGKNSASCEAAQAAISKYKFSAEKTIVLFSTLDRLIVDLSKEHACVTVKFDHFPTRAYSKRSVLEFDFGPTILQIDAFSNGPSNDECSYTLDTMSRNKSFFWFKVPAA